MRTSFFKTKKFEERRHGIGGVALLSLLFFGNYIPVLVTLTIMLLVALMAICSFSGFRAALVVSTVTFLVQFGRLYFRDFRTFDGVSMGFSQSLELSLETSVFF
jgi:hypothetical protein